MFTSSANIKTDEDSSSSYQSGLIAGKRRFFCSVVGEVVLLVSRACVFVNGF